MDADRRVAREVCSEARVVAEGMVWFLSAHSKHDRERVVMRNSTN